MKIGSLYSASDKSLFDALTQSIVTKPELRKLFFAHGIIISKDTPRKQLAMHFSRLLHDFDDFQALAKLFDTGQRKERLSCIRVKSEATLDDFEAAAGRLVAELTSEGHVARMVRKDDGPLQIEVKYKKFHFDKNEFRQVVTKTALLNIEKSGGTILISGPQNLDVDSWCRDLIKDIKDNVTDDLDIDEISLEDHPDSAVRTKFFINLTSSVEGFAFDDVSDVYLHRPKDSNITTSTAAEPLILEDESQDSDSEGDSGTNVDLGVHISRASLRGQGVLASTQMRDLLAQGFYISKIVWTCKNSTFDSDVYEFEAQFSEPESCTMFSYATKGFYGYKGSGEYNAARSQFSKSEDVRLGRLIEAAAHKVFSSL